MWNATLQSPPLSTINRGDTIVVLTLRKINGTWWICSLVKLASFSTNVDKELPNILPSAKHSKSKTSYYDFIPRLLIWRIEDSPCLRFLLYGLILGNGFAALSKIADSSTNNNGRSLTRSSSDSVSTQVQPTILSSLLCSLSCSSCVHSNRSEIVIRPLNNYTIYMHSAISPSTNLAFPNNRLLPQVLKSQFGTVLIRFVGIFQRRRIPWNNTSRTGEINTRDTADAWTQFHRDFFDQLPVSFLVHVRGGRRLVTIFQRIDIAYGTESLEGQHRDAFGCENQKSKHMRPDYS